MRLPRKTRKSKKVQATIYVTKELKKRLDKICKEIVGATPSLLIYYLTRNLEALSDSEIKQLREAIQHWRWNLEHTKEYEKKWKPNADNRRFF